MKNKIIMISTLLVCCLFTALGAKAQNSQNGIETSLKEKAYIGITGGFSPVFGNFSKAEYSDPKSGFASSGMNIGLTGVYFIKHHFGIAGLISYNGYGYHGAQSLADGYKEAFDLDSTTLYRKGNNRAFNILVGPYYSLPLSDRLHLDFSVLLGYTNAQLSGNELFLEDGVGNQFEQKPATASAFGYQAGAGLRYDLARHFGVGVQAAYFGAVPDFKIDNINRKNEAGRLLTRYHQPIQSLNLNLMLSYRL
ncbi:MAG TPA: outer membrane beta-barrel protein [Edaphocola sp.]|nr:outer membrane beta-barrel protein [Edaphocola sp.]